VRVIFLKNYIYNGQVIHKGEIKDFPLNKFLNSLIARNIVKIVKCKPQITAVQVNLKPYRRLNSEQLKSLLRKRNIYFKPTAQKSKLLEILERSLLGQAKLGLCREHSYMEEM